MRPSSVIWASQREAHFVVPRNEAGAWYTAISQEAIHGLAEVTPGSQTLQIRIEDGVDAHLVVARVRAALSRWADQAPAPPGPPFEIPFCSDPDLAPDLEGVARAAGLSVEAAADLYVSGQYTVRFLGFSPGFPYLDGLPERLHTPRLSTPRPRVRAGSVGIAGARTGIYPQATPGGWRLIGATPLRLFDPCREQPAMLTPGARLTFRRIARAEFDALDSADTR